jgi:hypothetical protein
MKSAQYVMEEDAESLVFFAEITVNDQDCQFELGYFEEQVPTGPLQADVPTSPSITAIPTIVE